MVLIRNGGAPPLAASGPSSTRRIPAWAEDGIRKAGDVGRPSARWSCKDNPRGYGVAGHQRGDNVGTSPAWAPTCSRCVARLACQRSARSVRRTRTRVRPWSPRWRSPARRCSSPGGVPAGALPGNASYKKNTGARQGSTSWTSWSRLWRACCRCSAAAGAAGILGRRGRRPGTWRFVVGRAPGTTSSTTSYTTTPSPTPGGRRLPRHHPAWVSACSRRSSSAADCGSYDLPPHRIATSPPSTRASTQRGDRRRRHADPRHPAGERRLRPITADNAGGNTEIGGAGADVRSAPAARLAFRQHHGHCEGSYDQVRGACPRPDHLHAEVTAASYWCATGRWSWNWTTARR